MDTPMKVIISIVVLLSLVSVAFHYLFTYTDSLSSVASDKPLATIVNHQPVTASEPKPSANPFVYGDWSVSKVGNMVLYSSHGSAVWGHKLGWIKKQGHCNDDLLYLTFSTHLESKELFDVLKEQRMDLTLSFPEVEGVSNVVNPEIIGSNDVGSLKVVTLSNINKDKVLDLYMQKLAKIDVAINAPFSHLFDIPNETWSLNGYVASQLKAKEICEGLPTKGGYRVAVNSSETRL